MAVAARHEHHHAAFRAGDLSTLSFEPRLNDGLHVLYRLRLLAFGLTVQPSRDVSSSNDSRKAEALAHEVCKVCAQR